MDIEINRLWVKQSMLHNVGGRRVIQLMEVLKGKGRGFQKKKEFSSRLHNRNPAWSPSQLP